MKHLSYGLFIVLFSLTACDKAADGLPGGNSPDPVEDLVVDEAVSVKATVVGQVVDQSGAAVKFAKVSANGAMTLSDENGFYNLLDVDITDKNKVVVSFEKDDYAINQQVVPVTSSKTTYTSYATITQYHHVELVQSNATVAATVSVADPAIPGGAGLVDIDFPIGSIPVDVPVSVSVVRGDPTSPEGQAIFPGDYYGADATNADGGTMLESIAFTEITLKDEQGNEITTLNQPATITMKLPDAMQSRYTHGDTIPWWSYDEVEGVWVREDADPSTPELDDSLIINNGSILYAQAAVTHFSWWNVDQPIESHSCLCTEVVNESNEPIAGAEVQLKGVSYSGWSQPVLSDQQGKVCVNGKRSVDANDRERVTITTKIGDYEIAYLAADDIEGDTLASPVIKTSTEYGSTLSIDNPGVCLELQNKLNTPLSNGVVEGMIQDANMNPISGLSFYTKKGDEVVTDSEGRFSFNVPVGIPTSVYRSGLFSEGVTVASSDVPVNITITLPNKSPWVQAFESTIDRVLIPGEEVHFSVQAVDPEGGALTYQWSMDGSHQLTVSEDGLSASFVVPAGLGDSRVRLIVTDSHGAQSVRSQGINWGEGVAGINELRLTIYDDKDSVNPVIGVIVFLHDPESGAIIDRRISNELGVVDFGYVGSNRATYTTLHQHKDDCINLLAGTSYMNTHVDTLVGDDVYYLEHITNDEHYEGYMGFDCTGKLEFGDVGLPWASYDLTVDSIQPGNLVSLRDPRGYLIAYPGTGATTYTSLDTGWVHPYRLNSNGNFDLFVITSESFAITSYGYVLDIPFLDGGHQTHNVSMVHTPLSIPWEVTPSSAIPQTIYFDSYVSVDTPYSVPDRWRENFSQYYFANELTSGFIQVIPEIESQDYVLGLSYANSNGHFPDIYKRFNALPSVFDLTQQQPLMFDSWSYLNGEFQWNLPQEHDVMWVQVIAACDVQYLTSLEWRAWVPGNQSSWRPVEIPEEVQHCVPSISDMITYENGYSLGAYISLDATDHAITSGFDEYWSLYTNAPFAPRYSSTYWSSTQAYFNLLDNTLP